MGFVLNDVIVLAKNAEHIINRDHIFSLGNPTSYVNSKDLTYILNKNNLKKFNISEKYLNQNVLNELRSFKEKKLISFEYFTKILNFKKFSSIDINPEENPTFCLDVTKKNVNYEFFSKADMVYDTGSLGYTKDPISSLNFLNNLLKVNGIIVHQSSHNGFIRTGYFQFNLQFFLDYYNKIGHEIIFKSFGFYSSGFKKILMGKWKIDIDDNQNLKRIKKEKNSLYFAVKKRDK